MLQGIPPELLVLMQQQMNGPTAEDPRIAAIKNAMGQRVPGKVMQPPMASDDNFDPYNQPRDLDLTHDPRSQQEIQRDFNQQNEEEIPRPSMRVPGKRVDAGVDNEAVASKMAQDAIEGKGVRQSQADRQNSGRYDKGDPQTEEIDAKQIENIMSVWGEDDKTFEAETDMTRDEALQLLRDNGYSEKEIADLERRM